MGDVIVLPVCTSAVSEIDCGVIIVERTLPVSIYSVLISSPFHPIRVADSIFKLVIILFIFYNFNTEKL